MGHKNMLFDVMLLNMEQQLVEIAHERFGKPLEECDDLETYYVVMVLTKRILKVCEKNIGEKKIYYISEEFLPGRLLVNNLINLGIYDRMKSLLAKYGKNLDDVEEAEKEPSLGCGALGRMSVCFMDSVATLGLPGEAIGLNYHFGLFRQTFKDHRQVALPDAWIHGESWEERTEIGFDVPFGSMKLKSRMYQIDIAGYHSGISQLRLFDLENADESLVHPGEAAVESDERGDSALNFDREAVDRNLTLFLYPDNTDRAGRMLRLYQQYFLVSNAAQLILREMKSRKYDLRELYDHAVIQLCGTQPTLLIPELIRILVEEKALSFTEAVEVVKKTCAYTNNTARSEVRETWYISELEEVVPQLVPIIRRLDIMVRRDFPDPRVGIIDQENRVHMANLCIHFVFSINGATSIHTQLLERMLLRPFYEIYPEKFSNKTSGITFRRWLLCCNPRLSTWLSDRIGDGYRRDAMELEKLLDLQEDPTALRELGNIKKENKRLLAEYIRVREGISLIETGIYDIQIGLLHASRRYQMNALYLIHQYLEVKRGRNLRRPVNYIFGAKAFPTDPSALDIMHLLLVLQDLINADPVAGRSMRVAVVTNYNVTYAEKLVPAADISEQISLASGETAGTGNMKMMLNGALILGAADGSNLEIRDLVGEDNFYRFGSDAKSVISHLEHRDYSPRGFYNRLEWVREAIDFITSDEMLSVGDEKYLRRLAEDLKTRDHFMALLDIEDYSKVKDRMLADYEDREAWERKTLVGIANAGYFSSDRAISDYNHEIWKLKPFLTET